MKNILSQEEIDFIKNLSNEMNTQDTRCTAQPYALVIRNKTRQVRDFDNCENQGVYWDESEYDNFDDFIVAFKEYYLEDSDSHEAVDYLNENVEYIEDLRHCEYQFYSRFDINITTFGYEDVMTADNTHGSYEGNLFLTEKACRLHMKLNMHHFREPDTYGIHLTGNPEMETLINLVHKIAKSL